MKATWRLGALVACAALLPASAQGQTVEPDRVAVLRAAVAAAAPWLGSTLKATMDPEWARRCAFPGRHRPCLLIGPDQTTYVFLARLTVTDAQALFVIAPKGKSDLAQRTIVVELTRRAVGWTVASVQGGDRNQALAPQPMKAPGD